MNFWQSSKIHLRGIEPTDAETFFQWNQDSERARRLDFVWPPTSLASVRSWAEEQSNKKLEGDCYHWLIETNDGVPVGTIASHDCNPRCGTFSYGIDIAKEHRGKGYAGDAVRIILRYYFEELRYQKVNIQVYADNLSSIHLHEKLGFQREGILRRMHFTHGQYIDVILYGMTLEEFREQERNNQ